MKETISNPSRFSETAGHTGSRSTTFREQGEHSREPDFVPTHSRLFTRRLPSFRAFSLLALSFAFGLQIHAQENARSTGEIEDWVARQIWVANIESGLPAGVNLAISSMSDPEEKDSDWRSFQLRTVHGEGSGFDPNVSPSLGIFRVNADRTMVEWLEPVSGEWDSLSAFLRSMKPASKQEAAPVPDKIAPGKNTKNELSADLDGDGKTETVRWKQFDEVDGERFFRLEAIDDDGTVLWTGPKERTFENAYVFFESHFGISLPQLLHDIDNDGTVELLGPEPQSDVSPTYFRRLSWREGAFSPQTSATLVMDESEGDTLNWKEGDYSHGIWVSRFGPVTSEGLVQVRITDYDESGDWRGGTALIRFRPGGAMIEQWIQPLGAGE